MGTKASTSALLSATNEAIIRSGTPIEAMQRLCQAALASGHFLGVAVLIAEAGEQLAFAAGAGESIEVMRGVRISTAGSDTHGQGLAGTAFRTRAPAISDDYMADPRMQPWRAVGERYGVASAAAIPILDRGKSTGVLMLYASTPGAMSEDILALMTRVCENISFALQSFRRQRARLRQKRAAQRLARMYGALGETNEAVLRARTPDEMFARVCEAAAAGGNLLGSAAVFLAQPGSPWLKFKTGAGTNIELIRQMPLSLDPDSRFGGGLHGPAFREGKPVVSYDTSVDPRTAPWRVDGPPVHGCAVLPLRRNGASVGILKFFFGRSAGRQSGQIEALMARIADNVSFALDMFEREARMLRSERMLAALSATNEAIFRAQTEAEMLRLVCEAAVNAGNFLTVAVSRVEEDSAPELKLVAAAGAFAQLARQMRISADQSHEHGRGIGGIALRSKKICVSNDVLNDERVALWRQLAEKAGVRSAAALPLLKNGEAIGLIHFFFGEDMGAIDEGLLALLTRLGENVAFGLEAIEREDRRIRLARMLAALSATNEAIMRARTREEMFEMVCAAAVEGAKFTSTTIFLPQESSDHFAVAACAGPNESHIRQFKYSPRADLTEGQGLVGTAFRSGQPCIANNYQSDRRTSTWHAQSRVSGAQSGAALPLLSHGRTIGVLLFMSLEINTFTPELIRLLQRLTENVSFALENFERADENRMAEERIRYLASHDNLTDLPNRARFGSFLNDALETAAIDEQIAVLFIDLDRFKIINDSLGHAAGDALLIETAGRLRSAVPGNAFVARLGGDEFVVMLEHVNSRDEVASLARKLLLAVGKPLSLGSHECQTTASIGIAMFPADGRDEAELTRRADLAMYEAKEEGKNAFRFYNEENTGPSVERLEVETRLRHALDRGELSLHYQPKVSSATGVVTGLEALLRWHSPQLGQVSPVKFIPIAEECGLIIPIGRWALKVACAQAVEWQRQGLPAISMAVNLSPRQFLESSLLETIDEALSESGLRPELLQLEITESMVMLNVDRAVRLLDGIQARGVTLAIDDFGTGYSSMSMMKKFPIDTIKIDRSFVRDLANDRDDQAIIEAIIQMGKALGLIIVAEGVETLEQKRFLDARACDEMQGYLFSKPVPAEQIPGLLRTEVLQSPPLQPENTSAHIPQLLIEGMVATDQLGCEWEDGAKRR